MEINIVGEDLVTQTIIERLLKDYRPDFKIKDRLPARGGQIKSQAPKLNLLKSPLILLTDLDEYLCPPSLIKDWIGNLELRPNFLFRVAHEEAESWLMADRFGFSNWLGVNSDLIPETKIIDKKKNINEIIFPLKPSLYMMLKIVSESFKADLVQDLSPVNGAKKGPGYNSAMTEFIKNHWNIKAAAANSYSLSKAIQRIVEF
jgi:hypothetical protein